MAGFRAHVTASSLLGMGYAGVAYFGHDVPLPTCLLAGGLCGVSGMLPDLDSDSGIPLRESVTFAAAIAPMLLVERFARMGMSPESIALAGAAIYLIVRFGLAEILRNFTVHRGMFHSLPAAVIAGELAYLLCASGEPAIRYYKAGGVVVGFVSHLLLDEMYSIDFARGRLRLKNSFGTALKIWGDNLIANLAAYVKMALLAYVILNEGAWMGRLEDHLHDPSHPVHAVAEDADDSLRR